MSDDENNENETPEEGEGEHQLAVVVEMLGTDDDPHPARVLQAHGHQGQHGKEADESA